MPPEPLIERPCARVCLHPVMRKFKCLLQPRLQNHSAYTERAHAEGSKLKTLEFGSPDYVDCVCTRTGDSKGVNMHLMRI